MTRIIRLSEAVGIHCITQQDGQKIYREIHPLLRDQQQVELDFTGVNVVASPFLNAAIGQLLRDLTPETLNTFLKFPNLPTVVKPILRRVIANARAYYTNQTASEQ